MTKRSMTAACRRMSIPVILVWVLADGVWGWSFDGKWWFDGGWGDIWWREADHLMEGEVIHLMVVRWWFDGGRWSFDGGWGDHLMEVKWIIWWRSDHWDGRAWIGTPWVILRTKQTHTHIHTHTHFKATRKTMVRLQTYNRSHWRIMYPFSQSKLSYYCLLCVWCVCVYVVCVYVVCVCGVCMWCVCVHVCVCVCICVCGVCGVWCVYVVRMCVVCVCVCVCMGVVSVLQDA